MAKEEKTICYKSLGQATDTTWGRSSTSAGAGRSVKFKFLGEDRLEVCFVAVVNLVNDKEMFDLQKKYVQEANDTMASALKQVKETYKDLAEQTLKLKQISDVDKFEIIDLNIYNGKRSAYFRRNVVYQMS